MRRSLRDARRALSTRWRSSAARSWLSEMPHESSTRAEVLETKAPQSMHIPFHAVGCVQCLGLLGVVQVRELREDGVRERFGRNGSAVAHDEDLSGLLGLFRVSHVKPE